MNIIYGLLILLLLSVQPDILYRTYLYGGWVIGSIGLAVLLCLDNMLFIKLFCKVWEKKKAKDESKMKIEGNLYANVVQNMTNTQPAIKPTAMPQDAFSLRKIQMLLLWPLIVCLALAPLLFFNSEYYDYSKTLFWLSAKLIAVLYIGASLIIRSIEISSMQMPEVINEIDNEIPKKYIKIKQVDQSPIGFWTFLFIIALILSKWLSGAVTNAFIHWELGITPVTNGFTAGIRNDFVLILFVGIMMYLFEIKSDLYYSWTKRRRISNFVAMMLILLCVVASSRFDLVIDGNISLETYFQKLDFEFSDYLILLVMAVVSLLLKFLPVGKIFLYARITKLIKKDKNKKSIITYTSYISNSFIFLVILSFSFFSDVLLAAGLGILIVCEAVKWCSIANNESTLVENYQSDLQNEYDDFFKMNKFLLNSRLVLIFISIAKYVDNNSLLLLLSALLYGVMLLALYFL